MTARVHVEVRAAEGWERTSSCNGCRRSRSVRREDPEVVAILNIGTRDERAGGSGSEFRFCAECMATVSDTITAGVIALRLS